MRHIWLKDIAIPCINPIGWVTSYDANITFPNFHCILFLNFEGNIWQYIMDTRTLWRQQLWTCSSLPNAPSLQSLCVSGGEKQAVSWCLCKHLHQHHFRKISASTAEVIQGGGRTRQIKGWEGKHACGLESTSTAFTRYSDWCSLCTSAVGATPGFYAQRPKQQTAASGNTLIQVYNSLCLVLSFCFFPSRSLNLTIFSLILTLFLLLTAQCNAKSNTIVIWWIERGPCFIQWL